MTIAAQLSVRPAYFNHPLIKDSLEHLAAAVSYPRAADFRDYLVEHLHYSGRTTRLRYAQYISQRYSSHGLMNSALARAVACFGIGRVSREILCIEMLRAVPFFHDASSAWLAEQLPEGSPREKLLEFLNARLEGRSAKQVGKALVQAWREFGKMRSARPGFYIPVWASPPMEAFLYALAVLFPERTMGRVDLLASTPLVRALLWPPSSIEPLLREAHRLGHVSKISELDQYHQFTLAASAAIRIDWLMGAAKPNDIGRAEEGV